MSAAEIEAWEAWLLAVWNAMETKKAFDRAKEQVELALTVWMDVRAVETAARGAK